VADKITQQITDALAKAPAHPDGLALYAAKSDAGLFPNTAAAKPAAQKCLADGFVRVAGTDTRGKTPRDLYALTEKGWEFLLAQVNPKQVLEDFVRVLEERRGEVGELLDTARRMAESLQGLKDAVSRVLPVVSESRVRIPEPNPPAPFPAREGGASRSPAPRGGGVGEGSWVSPDPIPTAVAVLDADSETDLAPAILARLADWSGPTDCTLPELFRSLSLLDPAPTIGQFHDCLRKLCAESAVALHSWTGPLYAMPEPAYALLVGHGIAYYASLRSAKQETGDRGQGTEKTQSSWAAGSL
jgi:DNA-binding PadR family transcriptional regulator